MWWHAPGSTFYFYFCRQKNTHKHQEGNGDKHQPCVIQMNNDTGYVGQRPDGILTTPYTLALLYERFRAYYSWDNPGHD